MRQQPTEKKHLLTFQDRSLNHRCKMSSSPYAPSAKILNELLGGGSSSKNGKRTSMSSNKSLKSVVYAPNGEMKCSKTTYAICCNVLQNKRLLDRLYTAFLRHRQQQDQQENTEIVIKNVGLLYVLLYELLLGPNQKIRGGGKLKRHLVDCEDYLRSQLLELDDHTDSDNNASNHRQKQENSNTAASTTIMIPRYVRINTLKVTDREELIHNIIDAAAGTASSSSSSAIVENKKKRKREQQQQQNLNNEVLYIDRHVPDLLVMKPTATTRAKLQPWVANQQVVLQDKSSCFSALCLVHGFPHDDDDDDEDSGDHHTKRNHLYLDACAAPGNKTSHLAALLQQKYHLQNTCNTMAGTKKPSSFVIHAFDKSEDRFRLLKQRMAEMVGRSDSIDSNDNADQGTTTSPIVHCHNVDFLQTSGSYASRSPDPSKRKRKQELIGNPGDDSHAGGGGDGKKSGGDKYVFENVRGILLDPSCSGSGMAKTRDQNFRYNAIDIDGDDVNDGTWNNINDTQPDDPFYTSDRVASLSNFQYQALLHAVTAYPSCKRVVYSTCSIYVEENERVVERVLQTLDERLKEDCGDIENDLVWDVVAPRCLQHWDRRGIMPNSDSDTSEGGVAEIFPTLTNNQVDAMIRVDPSTDATNGFFVACLQRRRRPQKVGDAKKSRATADFGKKSLVHLPTGLTYYTDEFRNGVKELSDSGSSKDKKKRIEKPVGIKIPEVADGGGSTNMSKIAKKKAKRLEWKKQQHLKKLERLQKKNPQKDFKSLSR